MFIPDILQIPEVTKGKVVLIDGDMICYFCAAPFEDKDEPSLVYTEIDRRIGSIVEETGSEYYEIYLTGKNNFRNSVATFKQYKGNRYNEDGSRKVPQPKHLAAARSYMIRNHDAVISKDGEADDELGIAKNKYVHAGTPVVISSGDKDLLINSGEHHNLMTGKRVTVTELGVLNKSTSESGTVKFSGNGTMFFLFQLLTGDATDNIVGVPKVGEGIAHKYGLRRGGLGASKAYQLLKDCTTLEEAFTIVMACYYDYFNTFGSYKHWSTDEEMPIDPCAFIIEQAQLLWMRQYDGELWTIPEDWYINAKDSLWRYL